MQQSTFLYVTEIQRFCMHDGPGVRTTIFLKGCPLNCSWCHNPETQKTGQEILYYPNNCLSCGSCTTVCPNGAHTLTSEQTDIKDASGTTIQPAIQHVYDRTRCNHCGNCITHCPASALQPAMKKMSTDQILQIVEKDRVFYGKQGGITLSGGEPLLQAKSALELLKICKMNGINTAVETCGYFSSEYLSELSQTADLLLWDLKDTDNDRHKRNTGVSNDLILKNLYAADSLGIPTILRCILVNHVNTTQVHYRAIADIYHRLSHCREVHLLPYHAYSGSKMIPLGLSDNGRTDWIPTEEQISEAKYYLSERNVKVK